MESVFLNLVRGNRLATYMGLQMLEEQAYRYAPDYSYVEIPVLGAMEPEDEKLVTKMARNQHMRVIPACTVNPKGGYKILVEANPLLAASGQTQSMYLLSSGIGATIPGFYFTAHKTVELLQLPYAVRLYLLP